MTIIPHEKTLEVTHFLPKEEQFQIKTKEEFLSDITISFDRRTAEEIIFKAISTTHSNDLQRATTITQTMIQKEIEQF